jgi:cell division protein FtsB
MSIDLEYAIKSDIRNNPVLRETDGRERREFRRIVLLASLAVGFVLFSAWQHFETLRYGYSIEQLRQDRQYEETVNRQLRLNIETLRAPQKLEERARRELGLVAPTAADTVVIERTYLSAPSPGVVARAR